MASSEAKARRGAVKDIKQGKFPEDNLTIPNKKKKKNKKPYKVMGPMFNHIICWHEAATKEQAKEWIEKQKRSWLGINSPAREFTIEYDE